MFSPGIVSQKALKLSHYSPHHKQANAAPLYSVNYVTSPTDDLIQPSLPSSHTYPSDSNQTPADNRSYRINIFDDCFAKLKWDLSVMV